MSNLEAVLDFLTKEGFKPGSFAFKAISSLHEAVHTEQSINFYLEEEQSLGKVLDIFIRLSSNF